MDPISTTQAAVRLMALGCLVVAAVSSLVILGDAVRDGLLQGPFEPAGFGKRVVIPMIVLLICAYFWRAL